MMRPATAIRILVIGCSLVDDDLGCAPSTASNHLRKAEARVMYGLVRQAGPAAPPQPN